MITFCKSSFNSKYFINPFAEIPSQPRSAIRYPCLFALPSSTDSIKIFSTRKRAVLFNFFHKLGGKICKINPNIVLVLNNGRPLAISWAAEHVPAIVEAWQLGTETGNAVAQVLFGDYNPSGKLTMSFPRNVGQIPIYYNHYSTGRFTNKDGNVFWSHYSDVDKTPLYPFGYGLSYSKFEYSAPKVNKKTFAKGEKVEF